MNTKHKITISEPCHEDWDKMTPNDNGRFCESCSKNVVDFRNMLPDEIQSYFLTNKNICGKFKKSQLDTLTIQVPSRILYSQTHYHKIFLLALFVAMGTTLFSCGDKNGNKRKIDKIEITEDSTSEEINSTNTQTTKKESLPYRLTQKIDVKNKKRFRKKSPQNKGTIISEISNNSTIEEDNSVHGLAGINQYPEYNGGVPVFQQDIKKNFQFSKKLKHINGTLIASFLIEKDGKLDSINISKDLGFGTKEEFVRVLSNTKKWLPGEENGKKRNCKFQLSLTIKSDTIKKSFFRTKIIPKIDTIEIKRITKY
jgi:hypothetical protein